MVLSLFRQLFAGDSSNSVAKLPSCTVPLPPGCRGDGPNGPWHLPSGDVIEIRYQRGSPPLPKVELWMELVEHLKAEMPAGSKLVECEPAVLDGHPCVSTITRTDLQADRITYQGRQIVALRDRWYEFTCGALEQGASILRDASLTAMVTESGGRIPADFNPDAAKYDFRFPHHAVTRVRRLMTHLGHKITFDAGLRNIAPWPLPSWTATPSGMLLAVNRSA